jgi:hypothetical protein
LIYAYHDMNPVMSGGDIYYHGFSTRGSKQANLLSLQSVEPGVIPNNSETLDFLSIANVSKIYTAFYSF